MPAGLDAFLPRCLNAFLPRSLPMQTLTSIKSLLAERGLAPKKSLGQNFLHDHNLIRRLVDAAEVTAHDLVLEIGPGTGALTVALLERDCSVLACELDRGLAQLLRDTLAAQHQGRFTLIEDDCLEHKRALSPALRDALADRPFKLVANLPYGAATPAMLALLCDHPACSTLAVTIQKEVADRLLARAGTDDYGTISAIAQTLAHVERLATLPPECFWPRPEITSAMVLMRRITPTPLADARAFADTCQQLFLGRRKQLAAVLRRLPNAPDVPSLLSALSIPPTVRAEALEPADLVRIHLALTASHGPDTPVH